MANFADSEKMGNLKGFLWYNVAQFRQEKTRMFRNRSA